MSSSRQRIFLKEFFFESGQEAETIPPFRCFRADCREGKEKREERENKRNERDKKSKK